MTLEPYARHLLLTGRSPGYVAKVEELLQRYVAAWPVATAASVGVFLEQFSERAPATRAQYLSYLRGYLAWQGIACVFRVKVPRTLPPFVPQEHIDRVLEAIAQKRSHKGSIPVDVALFYTAIKTGLRREELAALRIADIDFGARRLRVRGKGLKDRVVPLVTSLQDRLRWLCLGRSRTERVFGLSANAICIRVAGWARRADVPIHTHSFRHYFATQLVDRGANIVAVQQLLGHARLDTTQLYVALSARHLREAVELLDQD